MVPYQLRTEHLVKGLALRDTLTKTPSLSGLVVVETRGARQGWLQVKNTHDEAVTIQVKGILPEIAADSEQRASFDVGQAVQVAAGSAASPARDSWSLDADQMLPYLYLEVTAVSTPTSGALDAWLQMDAE